jgi:hypothetical protein
MGEYRYWIQKSDESVFLTPSGSIKIGTTQINLAPSVNGSYTSYSLDLGDYQGFYRVGGSGGITINSSSGSTTTDLLLNPYGEIGVGRLHTSIRIIRQVLLIMDKLGIEPTEERVRSAAEIIATQDVRLQAYTENYTDNYREYYNDLAEALGYAGDILNLVYVTKSQEYSFEIGRSKDFMYYGWEAGVKLAPSLDYDSSKSAGNKASFGFDLILSAKYADFAMDNMFYYYGSVSLIPWYSSALSTFNFSTELKGTVAYLPENPRWYAIGNAEISFASSRVTDKVQFKLDAKAHYLITPNFNTFAGLDFGTNLDAIAVIAGGTYRIW